MTTRQQNQRLSEIAVKPTFRIIDGVSIRFVESDPANTDALLLSPWPESIMAYEPTWSRLAETTHLVAIDLPGFGRSERKDTLMSPRAIVRAARRRGLAGVAVTDHGTIAGGLETKAIAPSDLLVVVGAGLFGADGGW